MSASVNKVILVGNLGKDPEVRATQNGSRIANFTLATSESWKDKATGERKERTEWHRVSIYNDNIVGVCERYLKKGSKVYVEGALETRKWTDKDGQERYTTEVVLRQFNSTLTMLDGANSNGGSGGGQRSGGYDQSGGDSDRQVSAPNYSASKIDDMEDDIPF